MSNAVIPQALIAVCQQLIKDSKSISVGMIKSRAPKNTPLPQIIAAVQFCKLNKEALMAMETEEVAEETISTIETEMDLIKKMAGKIEELERRIEVLESEKSPQ